MLSTLTAESDSNKLTTSTSGFSDRATVVRSMYFWNADEAYIAIGKTAVVSGGHSLRR